MPEHKANKKLYSAAVVRRVAQETGVSSRLVSQILRTSQRVIVEALQSGRSVTFPGFGTFYTGQRPAGTTRHPVTGAELHIPDRRVAAFRVGAVLKRTVRATRPDTPTKKRRFRFLR